MIGVKLVKHKVHIVWSNKRTRHMLLATTTRTDAPLPQLLFIEIEHVFLSTVIVEITRLDIQYEALDERT